MVHYVNISTTNDVDNDYENDVDVNVNTKSNIIETESDQALTTDNSDFKIGSNGVWYIDSAATHP